MKKLLTICCFLMILPKIAHAHETYPLPEETTIPAGQTSADLITNLNKAQIRISARIHTGSGGIPEIPITGKFYLLRQSVVELLKQADFNPVDGEDGSPLKTDEAYLEAVAGVFTAFDEENFLLADLISDVLGKKAAARVDTNLFGYGKSGRIKAGGYFLFGVGQIGNEVFVWNHPVTIYGKDNEIEIDQYNAETVTAAVVPQKNFPSYKFLNFR